MLPAGGPSSHLKKVHGIAVGFDIVYGTTGIVYKTETGTFITLDDPNPSGSTISTESMRATSSTSTRTPPGIPMAFWPPHTTC